MADTVLLVLGPDLTKHVASFLPTHYCKTQMELIEVVTKGLTFPFATVRFHGKASAEDWDILFARDDLSNFLGRLEIVGDLRMGGYVSQVLFERIVTSFESRLPTATLRLGIKAVVSNLEELCIQLRKCSHKYECSLKVLDVSGLDLLLNVVRSGQIILRALELKTERADRLGLSRLCRAIGRSSEITSLAFSPGLSDGLAADLFYALSRNKTITQLELYGGRIGDGHNGMEALATMLVKSEQLRSLRLGRNRLRLHLDVFAKSLACSASLTHLDLSANQLDDRSMRCLSETLRQNSSLLRLNLAQNCVTEAGVLELSTALEHNHHLQACSLYFNPISTLRTFRVSIDQRIQL